MKKTIFAVLAIVVIIAAGALTGCDKCSPPPLTVANTLTGWDITHPNRELTAAEENGGVIKWVPALGFNPAGDPDSVASKTFDCGSGGSNCNISFPMAAPTSPRGGESMTIAFTYDGTRTKTITFNHQTSSDPVLVSLPSCGSVSVKVSVSGGTTANMQNTFEAGPFRFECANCVSENDGANGN